jgi:hypothetical protein
LTPPELKATDNTLSVPVPETFSRAIVQEELDLGEMRSSEIEAGRRGRGGR